MNKERETELIKFMQSELEQTGDFFAYHQWDGFLEDDDPIFTEEELGYMDDHYRVQILLVPRVKQ